MEKYYELSCEAIEKGTSRRNMLFNNSCYFTSFKDAIAAALQSHEKVKTKTIRGIKINIKKWFIQDIDTYELWEVHKDGTTSPIKASKIIV